MRTRLIEEMLGSLVQVPKPLTELLCRSDATQNRRPSRFAQQRRQSVFSSVELQRVYLLLHFGVLDLTTAMCLGLASLFVRQFGHAILEPPCHDKEALLLGYNTRNKTLIVLGYVLIPLVHMAQAGAWSLAGFSALIAPIALNWFLWTLARGVRTRDVSHVEA